VKICIFVLPEIFHSSLRHQVCPKSITGRDVYIWIVVIPKMRYGDVIPASVSHSPAAAAAEAHVNPINASTAIRHTILHDSGFKGWQL